MTAIPTIEELRAMPRADADRALILLSLHFAEETFDAPTDELVCEAGEKLRHVAALRDELRKNA